jgi:hypothetical protein
MEITITIDVKEFLQEKLEEANLDQEVINKTMAVFSDWLKDLDMGPVAESAEHYIGDAVSQEIMDVFLDEHPKLKRKLEES